MQLELRQTSLGIDRSTFRAESEAQMLKQLQKCIFRLSGQILNLPNILKSLTSTLLNMPWHCEGFLVDRLISWNFIIQ